MNDYIDIYCERLAPGFWAEPLNALTNLSFFIAAFFAYRLAAAKEKLSWQVWVLITCLLMIGTGSFLFHTLATGWAQLTDILPILFYQVFFLAFYARRIIGLPLWAVVGLLVLFFGTIAGFEQLPSNWLNGSLGYAPALIFLLGLGGYHLKKAVTEKSSLLLAAGLFILSLTFRSLDMAMCELVPFGLHIFWHALNGLVLYLTTRSYILNMDTK